MPQFRKRIAGPEAGYEREYPPKASRSDDGNIGYEPAAKPDHKQGNNSPRRLIAAPLPTSFAPQLSIHAAQPPRHREPMSYVP
jgi:hypothetical protein